MARKVTSIKTFDEMLADFNSTGNLTQKSKQSMDWFVKYSRQFKGTLASSLMRNESDNLVTRVRIGRMYAFYYDPKHKDTMEYYDRFPVIFPIEPYKDGFLGINLHYLPIELRIKLMMALYDTENNARLDENKKMKISYSILKSSTKYKWFKPCIKRYLKSHVKSRFLEVPYENWSAMAFLPVSQFEGASITQIWSDSRKLI